MTTTTAQTVGSTQPLLSTIILDHVTRLDRDALAREIRDAYPSMADHEVAAVVGVATEVQREVLMAPATLGGILRILRSRGVQ
jgi:hypothetical protein